MKPAAKLDRRCFLRKASGVLSGVFCGVHSAALPAASRSPSEQLSIAAVGVGNRGANNLIPLKSERITALCDVDKGFLERAAERFPKAVRYEDFREMLDRDDLDAVVVSCPDHTHVHAAMQALRRGRHVYCEKPLAHSVDEVRLLAQTTRQSGVVTQMGNQHHASQGYRQAVAWERAGGLGPVREAHSWTTRPIWPQGQGLPQESTPPPPHLNWDLWLGPAPARPYHAAYHPVNWRGWWDFGTGALGDMGPHLLDPVFQALELSAPVAIEAESPPVNEQSPPPWSIVRFRFPARGDRPAVALTWYDGGKKPPFAITGVKRLPPNGSLLVGERARLFIPDYGGRPVLLPNSGKRPPPPKLPPASWPGHHQQWVQACKTGGATSSDFQYGAVLTEACLLGNVAFRAGQPVLWDPDRGRLTSPDNAERFLKRTYREGWQL